MYLYIPIYIIIYIYIDMYRYSRCTYIYIYCARVGILVVVLALLYLLRAPLISMKTVIVFQVFPISSMMQVMQTIGFPSSSSFVH